MRSKLLFFLFIQKRRPPSFFSNLRDTLQIMTENFKGTQNCKDRNTTDREILEQIEQLLRLHGYETSELIHQYHIERLNEQKALEDSPNGVLTVRCSFNDTTLSIEVMSARNITPMDSNGSCDPFVRIHLLPEDKFAGTIKPKTNAQNKTLFPLFDEKFAM